MIEKVLDSYFVGLANMLTALTTPHPVFFVTVGMAWIMLAAAIVLYTAPIWGSIIALFQGLVILIQEIKK